MIKIKRLDGTTILTLDEVPEEALVHRELMADHYVKLSFSLAEPVYLHLGDYVNLPDFGRFELTEPYAPKYNSDTAGYDYTLQLDAYYIKWKNKKVRYIPTSSASETSFCLTASIGVHLNVIVNGINALGQKDANFKYDGTTDFRYELKNFPADKVSTAKLKQYNNTDFISSLNDLASIFECEWWVEANTIFFGKCKIDGTEVDFELDSNVEEMSGSQSKNEYATRIIAFGAARNLPPDYRKESSADVTVNGVVQKRIMLPLVKCPNGYVEDVNLLNETEAIEAILVDDNIFPRTKCVVSKVETYTDTQTDEYTGEEVTRTFYRLYDGSGFIFSTDYILEGDTLHILFQSGHMNGMDFECQYNDEKKYYEVVLNEEYGRPLPDENLHPEVDDKFVLYGWDSTKIGSTGLIDDAEEELYKAAIAKLQNMKIDPNTYNCTIRSDWYFKKMETDNLKTYSMGQPVRLLNPTYFSNGRSSRIIGYEVKLDFIYDRPMYIVGEATAYSRSKDMQEQIDSITYNGVSYNGNGSGSGGSGVYIITMTSTTPSSDSNVYSAARSDKQFLRRDRSDTAYGQITHNKMSVHKQGAQFGESFVPGLVGIGGKIDGQGNAELLTMIVRKLISSAHYKSGFDGEGYRLWIDGNGLSNLELDKLTVRHIMTVFELIIDRIRSVGGQIVVSAANGKIKAVEDTGEAYKIFFEGDNYFQPHDLMRCQVFKGENIRSYWVEIVGSYSDYVVVAKSEFETWATEPKEGDEVVLMGNTENAKRQNLISISATEDGEPRIDVLDGVKAKNFSGALRARLGNLDGITDDLFPLNNQPHGNGLYADNVYLRGSFLLTTGEDIKTKFDIVEGKISSSVEAVRQDFMQEKGYLNNPTFGDGLNHWTAENATTFFFLGNKWIWANDNVLTKKGDGASLTTDDGRVVVRIKNKYICQKFADLRAVPEIKTNEDGKKEPTPVYLSFFYKVKKKGVLTIGFENINNDGFIDYEPLSYSQELDATSTYQQLTVSGLWNATGDFKLSFTGDMFVYMFVLSTDRIENLIHTYQTLFEQSERLVKISAAVFDKDGKALEETGLLITSSVSGLYAIDADGMLKSFVGASTDGVKIKAANIQLEGLVTANENFKILEDGSIETKNASIFGNLISSDEIKGNSVVINAKEGYIKMVGPGSVQDDNHDIPQDDTRLDLWKIQFETDMDTLGRFAAMYMHSGYGNVRIDPIYGISIRSESYTDRTDIGYGYITIEDGFGSCQIRSNSIIFCDKNGEIIKEINI